MWRATSYIPSASRATLEPGCSSSPASTGTRLGRSSSSCPTRSSGPTNWAMRARTCTGSPCAASSPAVACRRRCWPGPSVVRPSLGAAIFGWTARRHALDFEPWRCCTNPHWPARCHPIGFSPAGAIRHRSAEGGHPIEDFAAEDYLTPLPGWAPGAKAISDDGFVSEERILHPALTMVP